MSNLSSEKDVDLRGWAIGGLRCRCGYRCMHDAAYSALQCEGAKERPYCWHGICPDKNVCDVCAGVGLICQAR